MMFVLFPICCFLIIISLNFYQFKIRKGRNNEILQKVKSSIIFSLKEIKTENSSLGLKNPNFRFGYADLYFTADAIIIFGYSKFSKYKFYQNAIIFSKEIAFPTYYKLVNLLFEPKMFNLYSFENAMFVEFGEAALNKTLVTIRFLGISADEKLQIEALNNDFKKVVKST
jgi:hypothetical protein